MRGTQSGLPPAPPRMAARPNVAWNLMLPFVRGTHPGARTNVPRRRTSRPRARCSSSSPLVHASYLISEPRPLPVKRPRIATAGRRMDAIGRRNTSTSEVDDVAEAEAASGLGGTRCLAASRSTAGRTSCGAAASLLGVGGASVSTPTTHPSARLSSPPRSVRRSFPLLRPNRGTEATAGQ